MLLPPLMIRSLERSFSVRKPSSSKAPTSPVCSQPPRKVAALASRISPIAGHHHVAAAQNFADLAGRQRRSSSSVTRTSTLVRPADRADPLVPARLRAVGVSCFDSAVMVIGHFALAVNLREFRAERSSPRSASSKYIGAPP